MRFLFSQDWHMSSRTPVSRIDDYPEVLFGKVEKVLQMCNELDVHSLLVGGDLMDSPNQTDYIKNRLKSLLREYKVEVYAIFGNHDILYYDPAMLKRSSIQTLVDGKYFHLLNEYTDDRVTFGDVEIIGHRFMGESLPEKKAKTSIVLAHAFYNESRGDKLYVSRAQAQECKHDFLCFGHAHNLYPVEDAAGTRIVRPGALSRGSSHTENRSRDVSVALIDTGASTVEYLPLVGVDKFEDVFMEKYSVEREKEAVSFEDIREFIQELKNSKMELNPYDLLLDMEMPDDIRQGCVEYLQRSGLRNVKAEAVV